MTSSDDGVTIRKEHYKIKSIKDIKKLRALNINLYHYDNESIIFYKFLYDKKCTYINKDFFKEFYMHYIHFDFNKRHNISFQILLCQHDLKIFNTISLYNTKRNILGQIKECIIDNGQIGTGAFTNNKEYTLELTEYNPTDLNIEFVLFNKRYNLEDTIYNNNVTENSINNYQVSPLVG